MHGQEIDYIGAEVSGDEIELMDFSERDAVEGAQGVQVADTLQVLDDDRPGRPGVIRH